MLCDRLPQPTEAPTEAPAESSTEPLTEAPTEPEWEPEYNGALGSAGSLRGTTLLISIFTNDAQTAWTTRPTARRCS